MSAASRVNDGESARTCVDGLPAWAAAAEKILNDHLAGRVFDERLWGAARSYRWYLVGAKAIRRTALRPPELVNVSWQLLEALHIRGHVHFTLPRGVTERIYD